jgi:DNA polymerase-1
LPGQVDRDAALARLRPLLEDPSVLKIGHNIKYDALVLAGHGISIGPVDDTMLASLVLEGGAHGHGMDELAQLHLGHRTITYDEVTGTGKSRIGFAEVPLERARDYAAEDAEVTLRLHRLLRPRLLAERLLRVYETIERPLVGIVAAMERAGVKVDRDALRRVSNDLALRLEELEGRIHAAAGRAFNIGSPAQLGAILFDEMGLKLPDGAAPSRTKTGAWATGADVLEDLAAAGHALPQLVLDWRQLAKLKSTYADALVERIDPRTGRVHTSFSLAATSTGRLSSSDPNLQNIPVRTEEGRKIRTAFVAEDGFELVSLDYSQIELRLLAHVAGIDALREAFREGKDIHAMTASEVFGVPLAAMTKEVRNRAKAINFGIVYGISAFGLARQLSIPQGEARAYIDAYFARYPGIRDYMDRTKRFAREHGYVATPFGRRCHVPGIASKNPAQRAFSERAAINAPIQGGAADIIKRAMIRVPGALAAAGLSARMLLQVHDELLFEVAPAERDRTIEVVRAAMEGAAAPVVELTVPLVVEAGHGRSWAEAH